MSTSPLTVSTVEGIRTLTMADPRRLNGWTAAMRQALHDAFGEASGDPAVGAVVLTGTDPWYSAGAHLAGIVKPAPPQQLRDYFAASNEALFQIFLGFDKPVVAAVNGPAMGAAVTSAALCDALLASEHATFSTPFARLGVPPEGCSSEMLPRLMGREAAGRMLGPEGWVPTAAEALGAGLVQEVVPHAELVGRAQALAAAWIAEGRPRTFRAGFTRAELQAINARESQALADAFLAPPFLMGQFRFLWSRRKVGPALTFLALRATRPAWSLLLRAPEPVAAPRTPSAG
jgi:enoyl-CoA hydratase/carnithine racemase